MFWDEQVDVVKELTRKAIDFNGKVVIFQSPPIGQGREEELGCYLDKMSEALTYQCEQIIGDICHLKEDMGKVKEQGLDEHWGNDEWCNDDWRDDCWGMQEGHYILTRRHRAIV